MRLKADIGTIDDQYAPTPLRCAWVRYDMIALRDQFRKHGLVIIMAQPRLCYIQYIQIMVYNKIIQDTWFISNRPCIDQSAFQLSRFDIRFGINIRQINLLTPVLKTTDRNLYLGLIVCILHFDLLEARCVFFVLDIPRSLIESTVCLSKSVASICFNCSIEYLMTIKIPST